MNSFVKNSITLLAVCLTACAEREPASEILPEATAVVEAFPDTLMSSGKLAGLYKNADPDAPVVLIIPGSGPTDLNGNNPLGVNSNVYQQLATGLAGKGVSTVRVDKRGMFSSAEAGDPNAVTLEIYAQDYSNWVNTIRAETGANCVYILGHSEGALMASAAANVNDDICGQILVSGVGRSFGDVLREQLKANPANFIILKEAFTAIDTLEAGERVDTENMHIALKPLFAERVQGFLISIMKADPSKIAAQSDTRTLIIHGETDIQTSVVDAEALAAATGGTLVIVPGVNHILKQAPKNRRKNIKTYSQPDLPISTEVVDAIAVFVKG